MAGPNGRFIGTAVFTNGPTVFKKISYTLYHGLPHFLISNNQEGGQWQKG
jgi:hypothetical protein